VNLSTEQVWKDFRSQVRRFLLHRVRDEALADDLLQETFIRIHRGLGSVRDPSRIMPWLSSVARNVVTDHYRRESLNNKTLRPIPSKETGSTHNYNQELGQWLSGGVRTLPDKYRRAFELAEIEGRKQRDVAAELGLSLSGAKSRIQRARAMLRKSLLDCCEVEFDRRGNAVNYRAHGECDDCSTVPAESLLPVSQLKH